VVCCGAGGLLLLMQPDSSSALANINDASVFMTSSVFISASCYSLPWRFYSLSGRSPVPL
jgi:hypothetical protein